MSLLVWFKEIKERGSLTLRLIGDGKSYTLCESNLDELYWTPIQQITHLGSAGEGLSPGDVFGTGTISSNVHQKRLTP
jgi:fumarylacetoacetase